MKQSIFNQRIFVRNTKGNGFSAFTVKEFINTLLTCHKVQKGEEEKAQFIIKVAQAIYFQQTERNQETRTKNEEKFKQVLINNRRFLRQDFFDRIINSL